MTINLEEITNLFYNRNITTLREISNYFNVDLNEIRSFFWENIDNIEIILRKNKEPDWNNEINGLLGAYKALKKLGYDFYASPEEKARFIRKATKGYRGLHDFFARLGLRFLSRGRTYLTHSIEGIFEFLDPSVIPYLNIDRQSDRPIENIINLLRNALINEGYHPELDKTSKNNIISSIYKRYGSFNKFLNFYSIPSTFKNQGYNIHLIDLLKEIDEEFELNPKWQRNAKAQEEGYTFQKKVLVYLESLFENLGLTISAETEGDNTTLPNYQRPDFLIKYHQIVVYIGDAKKNIEHIDKKLKLEVLLELC
ncbi:MAG: hypothetical protein QXE31_02285 [Candidatus Woesearchaeota archaeon]